MTDRELFESLLGNLFENKIVYHERVTLLCEVISYEVTDERFDVWLKWKKALYLGPFEPDFLQTNEPINLSASFKFGDDNDWALFDGHRIGRPYCPFVLWPKPDTVRAVCELPDEQLKTPEHLQLILWPPSA